MNDLTDSSTVSVAEVPAEAYTRSTVTVDFLYLDIESCDRCQGTEAALATALEEVEPVFESLDVTITVRTVHVSTLEAATATQLAVSPTIRIDGDDIQPAYLANSCESCGDLCECADDVACRLWRYSGEEHTTAPVGLLVKALVGAIPPNRTQQTDWPESQPEYRSSAVQTFFTGSEDDASGSDCCREATPSDDSAQSS